MEQNIECYFTDEIRLAYRALVHRGHLKFDSMTPEQCFPCNNVVAGKAALEKHLEKCSHIPGITYKFENQHLTFEDNFRFMGEQPFTIYFDLEKACDKKQFQHIDGSEKNVYPLSYCFVVAFHSALCLERITVLRSFNDLFGSLNDISYLPDKMIRYFDPITAKQLQSSAEDVLKKKNYYFFN